MKSHPKLNVNTLDRIILHYLDKIIHVKSDKIKFFLQFFNIYIKTTLKSITADIIRLFYYTMSIYLLFIIILQDGKLYHK